MCDILKGIFVALMVLIIALFVAWLTDKPDLRRIVVAEARDPWSEKSSFADDMQRLGATKTCSSTVGDRRVGEDSCYRMHEGWSVPFWVEARETNRDTVQIDKGTDIIVFCRKRVQVKCDWSAGKTGNLFLQSAERNPLKHY